MTNHFPFKKKGISKDDLTYSSSLWHSRKLASPVVYGNPLPHELAAKPPAYHKLVQIAPDGRKTLYLAAHAKKILGYSFEDSQRLIWELIDHCTQSKVVPYSFAFSVFQN
jgi:alpha-ketoglutarate-dependent 2,4-dichlorophenoxyacetate dioxygenase